MNGSSRFGLIRKNRRTTRVLAALVATIVPVSLIGSGSAGSAAQSDSDATSSLYFVVVEGAPLSSRPDDWNAAGLVRARRNQEPVVAAARELGARIGFRYSRAVNGFSARLTERAARKLAETPGVAYVEPVPIVRSALSDSVDHIGTKRAWADHRAKGKGVHVAVIDSGVDYTHRAFGGAGTAAAYDQNDPRKIERGSFPTGKVVAGHDFVGDDYDVLDKSTTNDTPKPDEDPLDPQGHGTHVAHTCCGKRVPKIGKGVAPKSKIHAYKVWGTGGSSTADVLVAAYERALDPNGDGDLRDRVDVVNFSGGVYYGTPSSTESVAASNLVDVGVTFVAAAGNSSGHAYRVGSPATAPGVVSVAATDLNDRVAGFSSPGPARSGFGFKPEIAAPGVSILAAKVGTGTKGELLSGTSMASPHVAGAAALLVDLHPGWSPAEIKAALVNHADPNVTARGSGPGPATLIGAGLVQVDGSADAVSLAIPSTISFGAPHLGLLAELPGAPFRVVNKDRKGHRYVLTSAPGFANVEPGAASVDLSVDGDPFLSKISFWLKPKASRLVTPRLSFWPGLISDADELLARFGQLPLIDGAVVIRQRKNGRDKLRVPWMVVPHVASDVSLESEQVDLTGGFGSLDLGVRGTAGVAAADLYVLGGEDPGDDVSPAEAEIVAFGARSFAGFGLGDGPEGLPEELDARSDGDWLSAIGAPGLSEPVEVGVVTAGIHETIETLQVTVLIDAGADGVFSDPVLKADHMVLKPMFGRSACVRALPDSATTCVAAGVDYDLFDSNLLGLVFDAFDVGLSEGDPVFSYRVQVCSDTFSGDVPAPVCDSSPGVGPGGTYPSLLDVTEPRPLPESPLCGGFWSDSDCRSGLELSGAPSDPDVLVFFPNNAPIGSHAVARTP